MKKVLILAYFFPPCNLTASQRPLSLAKYLHKFGYYPVIVTRNWDTFISRPEDVLKDSGKALVVEQREGYEVHYVPYRASIRDRAFNRWSGTPLSFVSKIFTALEIFTLGITNFFIAHSDMYDYACDLLKEDKQFVAIIASGKPFDLFKFAWRLHKEFSLPWIADYRDPWNSQHPDIAAQSTAEQYGFNQSALEKKWVGTAAAVITVSDTLLQGIMSITGRPGHVVLNGYMEEEYTDYAMKLPGKGEAFYILHVGNLSDIVPVEIFIEGIKTVIDQYRDRLLIRVEFVGVNYIPAAAHRIRGLIAGYENQIILTDRIPREQVMQKQDDCHMLLMAGHDYKGYPSSKIYEYVGTGKPVILCPGDNDIMEATLSDTGQGFICHTSEELVSTLVPLIATYLQTGKISYPLNLVARERYSRRRQTGELAKVLDSVIKGADSYPQ